MEIVEEQLVLTGEKIALQRSGGEGPPVIFLHGWADSSVVWRRALEQWSDRFRVYALDQPGHGGSDATDAASGVEGIAARLCAAIEELALPPVTLVGHSFGGLLALHIALHRPERIERLVLVNPAWQGNFAPPISYLLRRPVGLAAMWLNRLLRLPLRPFPPALTARLGERHAAKVRRWQAFNDSTPEWLYETLLMIHDTDLAGRVNAISHPTLVLAGSHDPIVSPAHSKELAERLPNARFVEIEAGHQAAEDNWPAFHAALDGFLSATRDNDAP